MKNKENNQIEKNGKRKLSGLLLSAAVFCWPFLYLCGHVFPVNGRYTGIGNDFTEVYYKPKVYLLANLANFKFPLWSPAESAGFPFYTNPYSQAVYPLNLPLAVWYKVFGGYNPLDHQIFTVLGISIFALGLFMWLRLINTNLRACLFATLIMSVSFKVTEITRFPNALHAAAWYPWVLYAITKIIFTQSLKRYIYYGVLLTFFVTCICTAGYPYYVFYCPFLFLPYMLAFLISPLRKRLFGEQKIDWKCTFGTLMMSAVMVLLLAGPYLWGLKRLLSETTARWQKNFEFSTSHAFNISDTLGSLVYPPNAQPEGWYFFSITGLLLIILYLFSQSGDGLKNQNAGNGQDNKVISPSVCDPWVKLFFVIWICVISYITYGRSSYLFMLLWKIVPVFPSLRVWGRLNIVLVPVLAWLLSLAYVSFESIVSGKAVNAAERYRRILSPIAVLIGTYAAVISIQLYFYLNDISDSYWTRYFKYLAPQRVWFIIYGAVAVAVVLLVIIFTKRVKLRPVAYHKIVLIILLLTAALEMRHVGAHTWIYPAKVYDGRVNLDVAKLNEASFHFRRTDHNDSISLSPNFSAGILENWYFERYVQFLKRTDNELEARRILLGVRDGTKLFFTKSIEYSSITSFLNDAARYRENTPKVLSYTGDELILEINAPAEGYLSFIDNWDYGWKVFVGEKEEKIELLFGTFKAVKLSPGMHRVRFSYQPGWFFRAKK